MRIGTYYLPIHKRSHDEEHVVDHANVAFEDHSQIHLRLTDAVCDALSDLNIFLGYYERHPTNPNAAIRIGKQAALEEWSSFSSDLSFDRGAFSYSESPHLRFPVGRYCSIATGVGTFGERHPIERVTSSSITYCFKNDWNKPQFLRAHRTLMQGKYTPDFEGIGGEAPPQIGHDVWIGQNVTLAGRITIGHGAVIAGHAVVTKNVDPYVIVGGNPAKPIRDRFPWRITRRLLASEWWNYHPEVLWKFSYRDPEVFCDNFEKALDAGELQPHPYRKITWQDILAKVAERAESARAGGQH